ncbi:Cupin domain-containing protein [Natronincola peptidivorans]|uniref:Cupin domain-containing protein n=1 Tax=Natronincola peptidivorans TaxID=426128 RepID=A0A1I0BHF6_9FIRM|nr:cupin domain-containing protein [Natronincola peptidivorans]SET06419.1 Cupin domain-containing protein [Natronincola peptidivorans]
MNQEKVTKASKEGYIKIAEGLERKTLVYGEKTLLTEFKFQQGHTLPLHEHPHEQTGYLVSGHIALIINDIRYEILPGDSWVIPGNVKHAAEIIEDSIVVEVFSPVREDFIP